LFLNRFLILHVQHLIKWKNMTLSKLEILIMYF
jgi:hypothetical protein